LVFNPRIKIKSLTLGHEALYSFVLIKCRFHFVIRGFLFDGHDRLILFLLIEELERESNHLGESERLQFIQ